MEHQIPDQVKAKRSNSLIQLARQMSEEYRRALVGEEVEVLFEEAKEWNHHTYQTGHAREYVKVAKAAGENLNNCILKGRITGFLTEDMMMIDS